MFILYFIPADPLYVDQSADEYKFTFCGTILSICFFLPFYRLLSPISTFTYVREHAWRARTVTRKSYRKVSSFSVEDSSLSAVQYLLLIRDVFVCSEFIKSTLFEEQFLRQRSLTKRYFLSIHFLNFTVPRIYLLEYYFPFHLTQKSS